MWKWILSIIIALLPVFLVQFNRIFTLDKSVVYHHYEKCTKHATQSNIIDIQNYNSDELIAVEDDYIQISGAWSIPKQDGRLVRVIGVDYGVPKFIEIPRVDFPIDISFHPFAVHIENDLIYVLNHAFHRGGTRVEVFEYFDNKAFYAGSVIFDETLGGTFGDIIVIDGWIYATQYSAIPMLKNDRPAPFISNLQNLYSDITQSHKAGVYKCPLKTSKTVECELQDIEFANSITSIAKSKDDKIFISFSSIDYNWIGIYTIQNNQLKLEQKLPIRDKPERITYSQEYKKIYAGTTLWPISWAPHVPAAAIEVKKPIGKQEYLYRRLYTQEKEFKGASSVARSGNYVITSSILEYSIYVCPIIDP